MQATNPHSYWFFNRVIFSSIELTELVEVKDTTQSSVLNILFQQYENLDLSAINWTNHWYAPDRQLILSSAKKCDIYYLHFPRLGIFEIDSKTLTITCSMHQDVPLETTRHLLLDQTLPRVWSHFFSSPILHASCIELDGIGLCFLGDSGAGKSTMAAAFSRAGGKIVSDDCLLLAREKGHLLGWPSYPSLRLLPDSFENMQYSSSHDSRPVAHYTQKKRICFAAQALQKTDLNVFILLEPEKDSANHPGIAFSQPSKSQCFQCLLGQSFALDLQDHSFLQRQFSALSDIVHSGVPFVSLHYLRGFSELPKIVRTIADFVKAQRITENTQ